VYGEGKLIPGKGPVRTGVTVIIPRDDVWHNKVPAGAFVLNGTGEMTGLAWVAESGLLEYPIALTNTLNVPRVADALLDWMLQLPGNEDARSVNAVVGETNDGGLNDIRGRHVSREDVFAALRSAKDGEVEEGCVGAGTGTVAFGFKGGIGTSSRVVPQSLGGFTVGVLVQSNFGGVLTINGAPVGKELGRYFLKDEIEKKRVGQRRPSTVQDVHADGSIMMIVATDAPLDHRNLRRLAERAMLGLARTGSPATNGSGDYVIAFSTAYRIKHSGGALNTAPTLGNDAVSPLFLAVVEATEEAIYNSLFRAVTMTGRNGSRVEAIPLEKTIQILKKYNVIK
jgi:D-aminopeptidase